MRVNYRALALVAVVAVAVWSPVAVAVTYDLPVQGQPAYKTDSGLVIRLPPDTNIQEGNPYIDNRSVELRGIEFESGGDSEVELAANTTQWTNLTNIDSTNAQVKVRPPNKEEVGAAGAVDELRVPRDLDEKTSGGTDLIVTTTGQSRVFVDTGGTGAVAVNADTGTAIDDGQEFANGTYAFDISSAGTYPVDLQTAPSTLFIFNESQPSQLIDKNASLRVRFVSDASQEVFEREVTDGTVNLDFLPPDQEFVVTFKENQSDFYYRRAIVESLSEQQEIYLLPRSQQAVLVEFGLSDYSGQFDPSDTRLFIESPINKDFNNDGSNETRYQVIAGDNFGASGSFPAQLRDSERYRLRIVSGPNERTLGSYTASRDTVEEIRIQGLELDAPDSTPYATNITTYEQGGKRYVTFKYRDNSTETSELTYRVESRDGTVIYQQTESNSPVQEFAVYDVALDNGTSYRVNWTATRNGEEIGAVRPVGTGSGPIVPLDSDWLGMTALTTLVFIAALAGKQKATYIALAVVGMAGVLMFFQMVQIQPLLWWAAALIAVGGHVRHIQTPGAA